ncbi:coenzyme PQQ synthesis protein D (PqqD) [Lentzea atacamensis]|uniref:Coenzyme PQQ synthesis protein D (PqqD) n=1 Tax=Lentzea atacamensis TaxID=531938 RepID=A0A316HPQ4_9PSEU|nr:PqqD family protein [Lentzea atacamensis]PWK83218.1 coenzyme PQQ synthesis protein D (PqqD) [Lentzea atacamensis]
MQVHVERGVNATEMDDGGLILLCERTGKFHRSNGSGAAMWTALASQDGDPDRAAAVIADKYQIDADRARFDLNQFIEQLREARLVRVES